MNIKFEEIFKSQNVVVEKWLCEGVFLTLCFGPAFIKFLHCPAGRLSGRLYLKPISRQVTWPRKRRGQEGNEWRGCSLGWATEVHRLGRWWATGSSSQRAKKRRSPGEEKGKLGPGKKVGTWGGGKWPPGVLQRLRTASRGAPQSRFFHLFFPFILQFFFVCLEDFFALSSPRFARSLGAKPINCLLSWSQSVV